MSGEGEELCQHAVASSARINPSNAEINRAAMICMTMLGEKSLARQHMPFRQILLSKYKWYVVPETSIVYF